MDRHGTENAIRMADDRYRTIKGGFIVSKLIIRVGLAMSAAAAPIVLASPAWAAHTGTVTVTTSNSGSSAGLSATLESTGGGSDTTGHTSTPASPPTSTPPTGSVAETYASPPKGCSATWYGENSALGKALGGAAVTATCSGNGAMGNLAWYGDPNIPSDPPTCTVIKGTNICSLVITWTPGKIIPAHPGHAAIPTSNTGTPSQLIQLEDSITAPAPQIGTILPDPTDPKAPYVYTNLPTQVSVVPSSLPPTITKSSIVQATAEISSTCPQLVTNSKGQPVLNAQGQKEYQPTACPKTYTYNVYATVTGTLQGYQWIPEDALVNGMQNVAQPQGEPQGPSLGSVVCGLDQNTTNPNVSLVQVEGNPSICTIDFIQPSTASGFWLKAEGEYSVIGQIHYTTPWNGQTTVLGPYQLGSISGQPATMQIPVAFEQSVRCSTAACENAGLAMGHETIQPLN